MFAKEERLDSTIAKETIGIKRPHSTLFDGGSKESIPTTLTKETPAPPMTSVTSHEITPWVLFFDLVDSHGFVEFEHIEVF